MSSYNQDELITMINSCQEHDEKLSGWELKFIAFISEMTTRRHRYDMKTRGHRLTALQQERLNEIWGKSRS